MEAEEVKEYAADILKSAIKQSRLFKRVPTVYVVEKDEGVYIFITYRNGKYNRDDIILTARKGYDADFFAYSI